LQQEHEISIVVPAYQEETRICQVIRNLRQYSKEIIVVDDGSTDRTGDVARTEGATVIRKEVRQGYLEALRTGFRQATGRVIVTFDADGEFYAADVPKVAAPVLKGEADLVLGARDESSRWSEAVLNWLANLRVRGDSGTGLRALSRQLALVLPLTGKCVCGTSTLEAYQLGARVVERPITTLPVNKPRAWRWAHAIQLYYVLRLLAARKSRIHLK
jgi:glycosyltransferase involved in cell wall biosynthesis